MKLDSQLTSGKSRLWERGKGKSFSPFLGNVFIKHLTKKNTEIYIYVITNITYTT